MHKGVHILISLLALINWDAQRLMWARVSAATDPPGIDCRTVQRLRAQVTSVSRWMLWLEALCMVCVVSLSVACVVGSCDERLCQLGHGEAGAWIESMPSWVMWD